MTRKPRTNEEKSDNYYILTVYGWMNEAINCIQKFESAVYYANLGYRYVYVTRRVVCMDKWGDGWMDEKWIGVVLS